MREHVKCPQCYELLLPSCYVCNGTRLIDKEHYKRFAVLAKTLRNKIQIPYKYFEIDNLLLINTSITEDPNRFQEYAVFRQVEEGSYLQVESVTVNAKAKPRHISSLVGILMSISKQPISDFEVQIRAYDDKLTSEEYEAFKNRFAIHEAAY